MGDHMGGEGAAGTVGLRPGSVWEGGQGEREVTRAQGASLGLGLACPSKGKEAPQDTPTILGAPGLSPCGYFSFLFVAVPGSH